MIKLKRSSLDDISTNIPTSYTTNGFIISAKGGIGNEPISRSTIDKKDLPYEESLFSFNGYIVAICLNGSCKVKINYREWYIEENSIWIIVPNHIVEYFKPSDDFRVEFLSFSSDYMQDMPTPQDFNLFKEIYQMPILNIPAESISVLLRYFEYIVEIFNNKTKYNNLLNYLIKTHLSSLLLEIMALYNMNRGTNTTENVSSNRDEDIIFQFFNLLQNHYKTGRTASFYADKMFMTPKYLSNVLKKTTGRPINSWIGDAVLSGAKLYLRGSDLTVAQISDELNFPNASYFGRFFRKKTGVTPKKYREE